jgi:glutamyl-tRNA reductase
MRIGIMGINYKSADLDTRERVSKACQKKLSRECPLTETYHCVILCTCNRLEIYFSADDLAKAHSELLNALREEICLPFEHKLYSYFGFDCFLHLAYVTAGLDSVIIAESEIQRQVKIAYEQAVLHYPLPSCMHYLFQKCLKLGKDIRTNPILTQSRVTIAKILFQISQHLLKDIFNIPFLFIGNSEINRKVMAYFKGKGIERMTLCTRSLHSAKDMAEKGQVALLPWDQLSQWQDFPVVICGSNSPHYLVHHPKTQMHTQVIFDLGVPRNVNPLLARHPRLTLINMEELNALIESKQQKNLLEINRVEKIIFDTIQRYLHAFLQKERRSYEQISLQEYVC